MGASALTWGLCFLANAGALFLGTAETPLARFQRALAFGVTAVLDLILGTVRFASSRVRGNYSYSPKICTTTSRCRGRVSNSSSMICCQVPSVRALPVNGTVREGPSSAART